MSNSRSCPICGSFESIEIICVEQAPKFHVIPAGSKLTKELFGSINLVQCSICRHIFNNDEPDSRLNPTQDLILTNSPISESMISRHEKTVDFLTSKSKKDLRVLDVGAGSGALAAAFAKRGHQVTVVEPSWRIDDQSLSDFGVRVVKDFWPAASLKDQKFDLILCVQVLEHIADPCAFLSSLAFSLDETGEVYLEVPFGEWVVDHASLFDISLPHINYFLGSVLEKIFAKVILGVVVSHKIVNGRDIGFVLSKVASGRQEFLEGNQPKNLNAEFESNMKIADSRLRSLGAAEKIAVYGATCGSQSLFGFFPKFKPEFLFDDTPAYLNSCGYNSELLFKVMTPTAENLGQVQSVLIAAYIHDEAIAKKIRSLGFMGEIFSLRPASDPSGTVPSLFAP